MNAIRQKLQQEGALLRAIKPQQQSPLQGPFFNEKPITNITESLKRALELRNKQISKMIME